ncbi:DNA polymerase I [Butyrivibrio sp. FCS014]|uniref:DNA polymerase I n=1 Tax=Butyrivibrio sp. FCS014 TaxID=1408304 RepID=UPI0004646AF7|nr:DNA polymerase I [Butyrivibrio sp. FCS014]
MSEGRLTIILENLIQDAFYSIPDFTDAEGNHIGGIYGALYKILSLLRTGEYQNIEIAPSEPAGALTPALSWQVGKFRDLLGDKTILSQQDLSFLEESLTRFAPGGSFEAPAVISITANITSDYSEVEEIFKKAEAYGAADPANYIGYYVLTDNPDKSKKGSILGLSLCFADDNAYYIPVINFITEDYLGKKLTGLSKTCSLSTFDIKESYRLFAPAEIEDRTKGTDLEDASYRTKPRCFDILIGAYIANPIKNDYSPSDISTEYLKLPLEKRADVFGKTSLSEADEKTVGDYACKIAFVCRSAAAPIRRKLDKTGMTGLFYNIEMPLSYILFAMEKEGIIARRDALKEYGDKLSVRIGELEKAIYEAAGCEFNINSPKQLGEILFEKLGLPAEKKTKSGYSTAADVLEKLAPDHSIVADILEYRGLAKLKSTYADGLAAFIEEDNRIHTSFNQTITATGRISSTEPNLQNIPMRTELGRLIRKVFVPKDGYVFADADYSQIELRILAHMSGDQGLISAYHEGDDIHAITASKVFHVPFEEVTPLQRRNAKAVNFGIVYGISSFGLSQDLSIPVGEAKEYMEKYFETYPGVRDYQNKVIAEAKENGYSVTMFGRRRPIPELKSGNFNLRQFGERVAMNAPIQGTAADIMKIAMINVFFRMKREQLKSALILQIHDELVIETAPDEVEKVTELLKDEMEKAVTLAVPMEVDCHTGSDWYEAK